MTMQTTTLPFQVAGTGALPQRANALPGAAADGGKAFGDTLSRELAQRQMAPQPQAAPAPAAAQNKPAASKPQSGEKSAQAQRSASREPAKQAQAASKDEAPASAKSAQAEAAEASEDGKDAAAASAAAEAATTPVTDMLAFMASMSQPAAAQPVAADSGDAALQSAFQQIKAQDGLAAAPADGESLAQEAPSSGFSLAAGIERAPAELSTTQDAPKTQPEAGQFQAQLREAAQKSAAATEAPAPAATQLQAQAARMEAVQPAAVPADRIPARVGSQGWDNQVSQRIVYMVGKEQAATLTLNPPDLGPVQVVLNVSNDQASVQFSSNQLEVRQALENAIPRLREMMSESGIALGNATVDAGTPDQRQASQDGERRANGGAGLNGNGRDSGVGDTAESAPRAARSVALGDRGMVDTFA